MYGNFAIIARNWQYVYICVYVKFLFHIFSTTSVDKYESREATIAIPRLARYPLVIIRASSSKKENNENDAFWDWIGKIQNKGPVGLSDRAPVALTIRWSHGCC
jgi:hypothetical protein